MNSKRFFWALVLGLGLTLGLLGLLGDASPGVVRADPGTRYVAPGGNCGGATPCYATVQAAVDAANSGDEIKVAQGTYTGVQTRAAPAGYAGPAVITQVVYISKTVTIRGGYTTANWTTPDPAANSTTLDAQRQGRVIFVTGAISPTTEGLRITGGNANWLGGSYSNNVGGGMYIITATAAISGNVVYSNTAGTGLSCGGGLFTYQSAATLNGNNVYSNTAGLTGGGMCLRESNDAELISNTVQGNTAGQWGGGVYLYMSNATLSGNIVSGNSGALYGGGVLVSWSNATLNGNTISGNAAHSWGGGLGLYVSDATLHDNVVTGNTAHDRGGGLYLYRSYATLGGNNVVADNTVTWVTGRGAGIYAQSSSPRLLHTTIARNTGGDGSGIYVTDDGYGRYSTIAMTNTIIISHTVGITVTAGNTATLNATLWHGNGTDTGGAGNISTVNDRTGDPAFAPDGYHLTSGSAAIDKGVDAGVTTDIDGDSRPWGSGYDVGADEYREWRTYLPLLRRQSLP